MRKCRIGVSAFALMGALVLGGCGAGNSGDVPKSVAPATPGPDGFLLFPNPQVQPDGSLQTDSTAYAQAYYAAIDPNNDKDTLAKWRAANGFDSGTGSEVTVVFGDVRDLGYGRRMTARQNVDGTIAVVVENYIVNAVVDYTYSRLNLDAAVAQDRRWLDNTNAIEFSPGPGGGVSFAKFFQFGASSGARILSVELDGRGLKAVPTVCLGCHGGRADPLTPPGPNGQPLFPLVQNSVSLQRGDTQARLVPIEVDRMDFSSTPGFTRADQEAALKILNRMVLCSYPIPAATAFPEDACRRLASPNEWQGTAAGLIKAGYGGDGLPNASFVDTFVPAGWSGAGQTALYQDAVVPACRSCHIMRGTGNQSDIDFATFAKFAGFADRSKIHVIDRGNMPLAKILYDAFWGSSQAPTMAAFFQAQGLSVFDAAGTVLRPGRPVADPGPDRAIIQGPTTLAAGGSLYANTYNWSILSGPNGTVPPTNATLTGATSIQPTFNATADGIYVLQLVVGNGSAQSAPAQLRLVVNSTLAPAPTSIRFSDIKAAVQTIGCTACHAPGGPPPVFFANVDRNGDGIIDATDDLWFYADIRGRVNFTDLVASPLLRKPSGNHHGGGLRPGFDTTALPSQPTRANYDRFLNWILNGAPQ